MSVRRAALQPFTLSDGTHIGVGEWACAPSGAINKSADYYPSPDQFSGFRFVDTAYLPDAQEGLPHSMRPQQPNPSKLTDVDHSFLMWGIGRMAWYVNKWDPSMFDSLLTQWAVPVDTMRLPL